MNFLKRNIFFFFAGLATIIMVGAGIYLGQQIEDESAALSEEIRSLETRLRGYREKPEEAPSPFRVGRLEEEKISREGRYQNLSARYTILPVLTVPDREVFPVLYYKENVYQIFDYLQKTAQREGVDIPGALGISETGLPRKEELPALFIMLDTIKRLCEEIFLSRIQSLDSLAIQAPVPNPFYIEVPLAISITGTSSRVAYFLENMASSQTIFVLENIQMSVNGDAVTAGMSLKRILWSTDFLKDLELVAPDIAAVAAPSGAPPGMPPPPPGMPPPPPPN